MRQSAGQRGNADRVTTASGNERGNESGGAQHDPHQSRSRWWVYGLIGAVVLAGGGLIGAAVASPGASAEESGTVSGSGAATAGSCSVTPVADQVLPSVVTVAAEGPGSSGTGSGEVFNSDGDILTNNHVIANAAVPGGKVTVLFADGTTQAATIVGRDALTDLAVLKVADTAGLKPIALGSSASLQVGEPVIAVGAPLGLSGTVTSGIVSALDRTVEVPAEGDSSALLVSAVQTDAAINPGNSGGALVDCAGQLVGIPSAGATVPSASGESSGGSIGLGFAIPVDTAKTIADQIISTGKATHSFFGLQTVPIPAAAVQAGVSSGLYVAGVVAGGPADQAGLRAGDVITTINGDQATSNIQLQELTLTKSPGDTVELGYVRTGQQHTATVTLGTQP
jgi:putative serine protease PepD